MAYTLDETDRQIIVLLQRDGRLSNVEIGRQLGLAEGTVRKRLERLLNEKIIRVIAVADPAVLGLTASVLIHIQTELGDINAVAQRLAEIPAVQAVSVITGNYDIIIEAALTSSDRLLAFLIDKISTVPGVKRTETSHVMRVVKRARDWSILQATPDRANAANTGDDPIIPGAIVITS